MKTNDIPQRLKSFRSFMEDHNLSAFIVPSTDAHLSEYPPKVWESRKWISGFTGSAGTAVITLDKAGVWTDSRYFLQAADELEGTGFELFKMGQSETPEMISWIISQLRKGQTVGIDGLVYATSDALQLQKRLDSKGIQLETLLDPFSVIWEDRPEIPKNKVFSLPENITGELTKSKIERINTALEQMDADGLILLTLDSIAWTFNIRGNDVEFNPVGVAYAYISKDESILFIDSEKLTDETSAILSEQGVTLKDYNEVFSYVSNLSQGIRVCITGNKINYKLYQSIPDHCKIIDIASPVDLMKSKKNESELAGFRNAMIRDGVALVKFYMWLEKAIPSGEVKETDIEVKLREYRSQQDLYVGESFSTIAGYAGNGAIVHYHAHPETCKTIKPEGLLLIDSGGQYQDGTTDITSVGTVGQAHLGERRTNAFTLLASAHPRAVQQRQGAVLEDIPGGHQRIVLEDEADVAVAQPGGLLAAQPGGGHAVDLDGARVGGRQQSHEAQQG